MLSNPGFRDFEMPISQKRRFVIDASVAQAASGSGSSNAHPGKHCRESLIKILGDCYRIAMTYEVFEEWKRHESQFARQWRLGMVARKKLCVSRIADETGMASRLSDTTTSGNEKDAIRKDCHLILAALAADKCIVSLDTQARTLFVTAATTVAEIAEIDWIDPANQFTEFVNWLDDGAPSLCFALRAGA